MRLSDPIEVLRGMGPKTAEAFRKNGISTLEDLIHFFPRAWIDASRVIRICDLRLGQSGLLDVQVVTAKEGMSQRTRIPYLRALVADTSGSVEVMWFHARYLKDKIKPGSRFMIYGRLHGWQAQQALIMSPKFITEPSILAVYSEISGLPSAKIRQFFLQLKPLIETLPDYLPTDILLTESLLPRAKAISAMHFPQSMNEIAEAKKRLAFDELLMLMVPALRTKMKHAEESATILGQSEKELTEWKKSLPFPLTEDQNKVIAEVIHDLSQPKPMNRLVQGDVGSGKTVIGLAGVLQTVLAGKQAVWLAPTELLARQHYETTKRLLLPFLATKKEDFSLSLWTRTQHLKSSCNGEEKAINPAECDFIIGTHALLSDKISLDNLGLLIIDEQHRFGVKQRAQLRMLGGKPIHLLSMTATPIPRTLALVLYGDLDLSTIHQKPAGRKEITTRVVEELNRAKSFQFIDRHIDAGGQVYVVCPTIEPSKDEEANVFNQLFEEVEEKKAVKTWYEKLQKQFPHRHLAMLHGKLKANEKNEIMERFRTGEINILVTTTVIEVGVDVPNANIMVIEAAERFGLAQLHQLRGRVGRSDRQSFCLLFPSNPSQKDNARLKIMEQSSDGFVLAEKDLELRGPGELTGLAQSGIPTLRFASFQDKQLIQRVQSVAPTLLDSPLFSESTDRFWRMYHPE